jgi:peptidoglycan/LPS O-acetylase OafA/YrhL
MQNEKHLPALDGLRGLAVLIVFAFHTLGGAHSTNPLVRFFGYSIQGGWSGVTLFFILSGFLITGILFDSKGNDYWLRNFYIRRVLRIFPLYYATILIVLIGFIVAHKAAYGFFHTWVLALFLQNSQLYSGLEVSPLWVTHLWSLAVEEQFYLIWPFLLLKLQTRRQVQIACLAVFVASAIFRIYVCLNGMWFDPGSVSLFSRGGELALGACLAMCFRDADDWSRVSRWAPNVSIVSLAVFAIAGHWRLNFEVRSVTGMLILLPAITFFWGGILVMSLGRGIVSRAVSAGWLRWLGGISYGFYIFHVLLIPFYVYLGSLIAPYVSRNLLILSIMAFNGGISIPLAWLSSRFFEKRFLNLRHRFTSSLRPEIMAVTV